MIYSSIKKSFQWKVFLLTFWLPTIALGQADSINFFTGDFTEALKEAKKQNKPLFIEFGADWCAPCVKMEQETFTSPKVIELLNEKYIPVKVDVDQFAGMDIAEKYKISEFPTYLFLHKNGEYYAESKGFFPPKFFVAEINKNYPRIAAKKPVKKKKLLKS
jgi:thioredoxin-related protein